MLVRYDQVDHILTLKLICFSLLLSWKIYYKAFSRHSVPMAGEAGFPEGSIRWAFNTGTWDPTEEEWMFAARCIPLEEKARIQKFLFKADAKASMAGCLMIRKFVHLATGQPYVENNIVRDLGGRPVCKDMPAVDFNISHQGNYTVLAGEVGNAMRVGIDIMSLPKKTNNELSELFRLTNKVFTSHEWSTILASESIEKQSAMFFRHWCLKESYTKAIGVGICTDLQQISFNVKSASLDISEPCIDSTVCVKGSEDPYFVFHEWLLDSEHCVSVALFSRLQVLSSLLQPLPIVPFSMLSWKDLIREAEPMLPPDVNYCKDFMSKEEKSKVHV